MLHKGFLMQCVPGKNQFDGDTYRTFSRIGSVGTLTETNKVYTFTGIEGQYGIKSLPIPVQRNTNYSISCLANKISGNYGANFGVRAHLVQTNTYSPISRAWEQAFNSGENDQIELCAYAGIPIPAGGSCVVEFSEFQLELGSTATAYEPFRPVF